MMSFPATGITVTDEAMLLAMNDVSMPLRNLCYYFSKLIVREETV